MQQINQMPKIYHQSTNLNNNSSIMNNPQIAKKVPVFY
jgi:hypothetical protein